MPLDVTKGSISLDFAEKVAPAGALAEDVEGDDPCVISPTASSTYFNKNVAADTILATKTLTFDANSLAFAAGFANAWVANQLRLYMDGVLMQTSDAFLAGDTENRIVRDFKVLSGIKTCYIDTTGSLWLLGKGTSSDIPAAIAVGSVKLA